FSYGSRRYYPDFLMLRDGIIYVLETKGEVYSDTRKNLLLSKLDKIEGYSGVLIYSDFMNKVAPDTPFDQFLIAAVSDAARRHGKERLLKDEDVPEQEKFVSYLPAYTPENAYRKFVKKHTKVGCDGWLQFRTQGEKYSADHFVAQMKGDALSP